MTNALELAAYHEAGHAVAAEARGSSVPAAALGIRPGQGWCAHTRVGIEDELVIAMAGLVAEERLAGVFDERPCGGDIVRCIRALEGAGLSRDEAMDLTVEAAREAELLMERTWPVVQRLALQLLAAGGAPVRLAGPET